MLYVGIDISNKTFTVSIVRTLPDFLLYGQDLDNTRKGFQTLLKTIRAYQQKHEAVIVCMEWTGVYLESLCHYLHGKKLIRVCVEPAQHIKRAFRKKDRTDKIDSKLIAEYAKRYDDQLTTWEPPHPVVNKMATLIASRELIKKHHTSHKNISAAFKKKVGDINISRHYDLIDYTKDQLQQIEQDMKALLKEDPHLYRHAKNLLTIKSIGLHCTCGFLVLTRGFKRYDYLKLAGLLGFSPRKHTSGTSVRHKEKSDRHGHRYMRRNLHLAAKCACQNNRDMKQYYTRMTALGKDQSLIYNNVSYKLLKRMCTIIRENRPYYENYNPVPPDFTIKKS